MSRLEDVERQIDSLSRSEKTLLLQLLVTDLAGSFPGIDSNPGVCGGEPCIVRTRIPVWTLEQARRQGIPESEMLRSFPTIRAADLAQAWAYVRTHTADIERQIVENESA